MAAPGTPGTRVGAFVVTGVLGTDDLGVVVAAHDPDLDRDVAIRLVGGEDAGARERLLRGAQALAKLSHPDVMAVHQVGTVEDRIYVVMDKVAGTTLRGWLAAAPRGWRAVRDVFLAAGRGLAAAHAAGIVHGDFGVDRVLVGDGGRVLVTDFGLVGTSEPGADRIAFRDALAAALTGAGGVPGWLRRALAAPHATMDALLDAVSGRKVLERRRRLGLALGVVAAAGAVWMVYPRGPPLCSGGDALLGGVWDPAVRSAVERRFVEAGKPWATDAFARVAATLDARAAALATMYRDSCLATAHGRQSHAALDLRTGCLRRRLVETGALTELLGRGDPDVLLAAPRAAAALGDLAECADVERLGAVLPPPSPALAASVRGLDDVLQVANADWKAGRGREAQVVAQVASIGSQALGYRPLEARALALDARLLLEAGNAGAAEAAFQRAALAADAGRDDALRLEAQIGQVEAAEKQQHFDDARRLAAAAEAALERSGDPPDKRADLAMALGAVLDDEGKFAEARRRYLEALALRERALGPEHFAVGATLNGLGNLANKETKWDEATGYYERAIAITEKTYGPSHPRVGLMLRNLAQTNLHLGKLARAEELLERDLAIEEQAFGAENMKVATTLNNLSRVHDARGDFPKARELAERALAIYGRSGVVDQGLSTIYSQLGRIDGEQGRLEDALAHDRRALEIREKLLGPRHWVVANSLAAVGSVLADLGKPAEALAEFDRASEIYAATLGPDHEENGRMLLNAGIALATLRRFPESYQRIRRALAVFEKSFGAEHVEVALAHRVLGDTLQRDGRFAGALAEQRRALATLEKVAEPTNVALAEPLTGIGLAQISLGRPGEAIAPLERALGLRIEAKTDPLDVAETKFALAQALWGANRDRARARRLAAEAREGYVARPASDRNAVAEIDGWLARHR